MKEFKIGDILEYNFKDFKRFHGFLFKVKEIIGKRTNNNRELEYEFLAELIKTNSIRNRFKKVEFEDGIKVGECTTIWSSCFSPKIQRKNLTYKEALKIIKAKENE